MAQHRISGLRSALADLLSSIPPQALPPHLPLPAFEYPIDSSLLLSMASPPHANALSSPPSLPSAALRPIHTTIPANTSSSQHMPTFQGTAPRSAEEWTNTSSAEIPMPLSLRLSVPVPRRHVYGWLARAFGGTRVVRIIQGLFASGRQAFFADDMESVVFIVMAQQQDGVLLPRVGFTDPVLRSAYCSAIEWYLETRGNPLELKELISQNNGLPTECFGFNIPSGGQAVRPIDHDIGFGIPVLVRSGNTTLRSALEGILLIVALICSLAVPYFVARYVVDALLCEEYSRIVKVTAIHIKWSISSANPLLRFAYSVFRRVRRHVA